MMASVRVAVKLWLDDQVPTCNLVVLWAGILLSTCTLGQQLVPAAVCVSVSMLGLGIQIDSEPGQLRTDLSTPLPAGPVATR